MERKYEITDDHIGIFDNFFDDELIDNYLLYFNRVQELDMTFDRTYKCPPHEIDDESCSLFSLEIPIPYVLKEFSKIFYEECYPRYVEKYSILRQYGAHGIIGAKIQKTIPGQGYHIWHSESMNISMRNRIAVFSLYLNDVAEGGETEFLYQKKRFSPVRNRLLIWPATYTHVHRGNQPLSNPKYLLTGWIEFGCE